jgi:hypothetical protein
MEDSQSFVWEAGPLGSSLSYLTNKGGGGRTKQHLDEKLDILP